MSNLGLQMSPGSRAPQGPKHRGMSWLAVLVSIGVLVAIGLAVKFALQYLPELTSGPEDYTGTGTELINDPKVIDLYLGSLARKH